MPTDKKAFRAPLFRIIHSKTDDSDLLERRLEYLGKALSDATDIEITLDQLVWIKSGSPQPDQDIDRLQLRWPENASRSLTTLLAFHVTQSEEKGPDSLNFNLPGGAENWEIKDNGDVEKTRYHGANWITPTTYFPIDGGVGCVIGQCAFRFKGRKISFSRQSLQDDDTAFVLEDTDLETVHDALHQRNTELEFVCPPQLLINQQKSERRSLSFCVHTGQEWTALLQHSTDAKILNHFTGNSQTGTLRHQRPNAGFFTETMLTDAERNAGYGIELLQQAAAELDLDDGLAWLYISHLLVPPAPLPAHAYAGGWVDLDDVARKTMGGYARNPQEAIERRRKIWHAIRYGARAHVGGKRTKPYFDKSSGREIETEIFTTPWQIMQRQQPVQPSLFPDEDIPVRVELVASREWTALTTSPHTAQYLPMGELLGAISPNQASGAWARSLGMAYFGWCRCHPVQALAGDPPPSRQNLLDQFPAKKASYRTILDGTNPKRALEYWRDAEDFLRQGDVIKAVPTTATPAKRQGWQQAWLEESPAWQPGDNLRALLESLAARKPPPRAKLLRSSKPRRTRSRKIEAE